MEVILELKKLLEFMRMSKYFQAVVYDLNKRFYERKGGVFTSYEPLVFEERQKQANKDVSSQDS